MIEIEFPILRAASRAEIVRSLREWLAEGRKQVELAEEAIPLANEVWEIEEDG